MGNAATIGARAVVLAVAGVIAVVAALVLLGWTIDNTVLKGMAPGLVAMNPLTAVLFLMLAGALSLHASSGMSWAPRIASTLSWIVALVGALLLLRYVTGWDHRLDRLLFVGSLGDNRVAPNTSVHFLLLAAAICILDWRLVAWRILSQTIALTVLVACLTSLVGYAYGSDELYRVGSYIPMALNTAALFALSAMGVLLLRYEQSVVAMLASANVGSVMARRLLPAAVVVPILLGFLRVLGERAGYYETEFGAALMVMATVVLLSAAIVVTARALNQTDLERTRAAEALAQLNAELERRVVDRTAEWESANRDLAHRNQENEMFVYSVSHDLRSPLVSLQGFSKELGVLADELRETLHSQSVPADVRQRGESLLEGEMRQSIRFIQTAALRLSNIIDALLRLSRAGRVEYTSRPLDMNALVGRLVESVSGELFESNVELRVAKLPPCHGDSTAIEQLFANLIGNAVKYRALDRAAWIEVGCRNQLEKRLRTYYVKDNGLGIPAACLDKVFQAFKRAHPDAAPGDGMGLAIVRRIVERHGGGVWVESEEGCGSTFFVTLPAASTTGAKSASVAKSATGGMRNVSRTDGDLVGGRR